MRWTGRDGTRHSPKSLRALIGPMGINPQDSRFKKNFLNSGKTMEEDSGLSGEAYNCSSPSSTSGLSLLYFAPMLGNWQQYFWIPIGSVWIRIQGGKRAILNITVLIFFVLLLRNLYLLCLKWEVINFMLVKGSKTSLRRKSAFTNCCRLRCFWMRIYVSQIKGDPERWLAGPYSKIVKFLPVLRIPDIFVRIQICGSVSLKNGFGSCYFSHLPSRRQHKTNFFS